MSKSGKPGDAVAMAVVGAAHGTRGELRVKAFTGDPMALGAYGPLSAEDGRTFTVDTLRPAGEVVVVKFREVADRTAAEAMSGTTLYVSRAALPADLEDDEFYHADLVGLLVVDEDGEKLGKVAALHDFGAGDVIEVELSSGRREMIPFTRAAVPGIDMEEGVLRVDSIAAGLGEEHAAEEGPRQGFDPQERPRGPKGAGGNR